MTLGDLSSRPAVLQALAEYDRLGRDAFLRRHGVRIRATVHRGFEQLSDRLRVRAAVPAGGSLGDQAGLKPLGVGLGLGGAGLLALAAGEGVTAGIDDDSPTVSTLLDHCGLLDTHHTDKDDQRDDQGSK
jgi:hypothetical protein